MFSFGIVLWEIWTRQLPFFQYKFFHDVDDAVERGERPQLAQDCPNNYLNAMQACWSSDPLSRPSFKEIVNILDDMHKTLSQ